MKVVILVYDGIDLWDLALPYELFRNVDGFEVLLASNSLNGEIICKDKNLKLGGFTDIKTVKEADILWICEGERSIENLLKDDRFKIDVARLALNAKKVVAIGGASIFLAGTCIEPLKSMCTHPAFARRLKKLKLNYSQDIVLENEAYITTSSRAGALVAVSKLISEFSTEEEHKKLLSEYNFQKRIFEQDLPKDNKVRNKLLKKLYKQTLKREANVKIKTMKIDSTEDSLAFYVHHNFNVLNFALFYGIVSNYQQLSVYIVGDKLTNYMVEGGGFYIRSTHATQQLHRVHTLFITGGKIIEERLNDSYLKYWIAEIVNKTSLVMTVDGADRLLGVSGALVDYDPVLENDYGEGKFVLINNSGFLLNWTKNKLPLLTNSPQSELYLAEYYF